MDLSDSPERAKPAPVAPQNVEPPASIMAPNGEVFHIGKLLGKGGFAKCYACQDAKGRELAVKHVLKSSLTKKGTERKLRSEIKIHASLNHRFIVPFYKQIETADSFYMILGLCENQTFVEMMRVRKHLTEPEVQYFGLQLLAGLKYLHDDCRVIHRDLKLGNLFLTKDMEIRIGDFGLAANLESMEDRRTTTCGTPNYIAPEVLEDFANGHSFEVDIWSFGVVLYTLLVGKPPFETTNVKATYKRIKATAFSFPETPAISESSKSLIRWILNRRPESRPTLEQIQRHAFFMTPKPPRAIPATALTQVPSLPNEERISSIPSASSSLENQFNRMNLGARATPAPHTQPPASASSQKPTPSKQDAEYVDFIELKNRLEKSLSHPIALQMGSGDENQMQPPISGFFNSKEEFPAVVVLKYVDYTSTWGLGYLLSNGIMGARFNDATLISWAIDTNSFFYVDNEHQHAKAFTFDNEVGYGDSLKKKVKLLRMFFDAIKKDMNGVVPLPGFALKNAKSIMEHDYLRKHLTAKHAMFFKLNSGVIQIKFFDKSELALTNQSPSLLYVSKLGERSVTSLDQAVQQRRKDIFTRAQYLKNIVTQIVDSKKKNAAVEA